MARADRYVVDPPRIQFSVTRACLRLLLGGLLDQDPKAIQFAKNEWGKLYLAQSTLQFNVSHTKQKAVILISPNTNIGVDIEQVQERFAVKNISNRFFSDAEKQWLAKFEGLH